MLATLIEAYENRYFPVPGADPVDILHFAIKDMGRSQAELAALLGLRARVGRVAVFELLQRGRTPASLCAPAGHST